MGYIEELRHLTGHRPLIINGSVGILINNQNQIVLQLRNEPQRRWGLIGGLMELGESAEQTLVREAREEAGLVLSARHLKLIGVSSGGNLVTANNGDQFYSVTTCFAVQHVTTLPTPKDGESLAFAWFDPSELPQHMVTSHRQIISDWRQAD